MENSNDWFGNLIMTYIYVLLGYILMPIGALLVLFGSPTFWLDTMDGFGFLPADATSGSIVFN